MKNLFLLILIICMLTFSVHAQIVVNENVNFNYYQSSSDNDLANHFSGGSGLTQILNSGITGGCLATSDSIDWGNQKAIYCSRYKSNVGDSTQNSICFKYDTTNGRPGSYQRAVSIWLIPYADFNHYIVASVTANKKVEILSYSWSNNPFPILNLVQDHWYRFTLTTSMLGGVTHQVFLKTDLDDLGLTGTSTPYHLNTSSGTLEDSVVLADTSIIVAISGTRRGGATLLDDFHFYGREGFSDCINQPLGIANEPGSNSFSIFPSPAHSHIFIKRKSESADYLYIVICDMVGKKVKELNSMSEKIDVDVSSLRNGIYSIQCRTENQLWTTKVIVSN